VLNVINLGILKVKYGHPPACLGAGFIAKHSSSRQFEKKEEHFALLLFC
jgi:hypothetical protein